MELLNDNIIDESIWGITYNDDNEPVTLSIWFKGDKRDGVLEVFWKCDNPPSDIDNKAALLDLIWEKTGMTSHDFKNAKFTRVIEPVAIEVIDQDGTHLANTTVEQFLADNTDQGELQIDTPEVIALQNLRIGETIKVTGFVGAYVTVRRTRPERKEAPATQLMALL